MKQNEGSHAHILAKVLKKCFQPRKTHFQPPKIPNFENFGKILNRVHPSLIMNPYIKFHGDSIKTSKDMVTTYVRTDGRTDGRTGPTVIPFGKFLPRGKNGTIFIENFLIYQLHFIGTALQFTTPFSNPPCTKNKIEFFRC